MERLTVNSKFVIASLLILNPWPAWSQATPPVKTRSPITQFKVKGKMVKIAPVTTVRVPTINKLTLTNRYQLPEQIAVTLPKPLAAPSVNSPIVTWVKVPTKLPPLIRYSLASTWSGVADQRLSPEWQVPPFELKEPQALAMDPFTEVEFKVLEALLLLKTEDTTPLALGLANPLLQLGDTRASAHEILARSLLKLKMRTPALEHLKELVKGDQQSPRSQQAVRTFLDSLKTTDYEESQWLSPLISKYSIPNKELGNLPLAQARWSLQNRDLESAWESISKIPANSPQAAEARFLKAMVHYRSNEVSEAKKVLEGLSKDFDKLPKELKSLTASTLAQIYFQQSDYKKAYQMYRKVEQDHPLWLQTLVETAWSQILNKDYEGAAGNMFSLHTNYFKGAYNPESYIVRTVGYLQLCQFGDALSVLKDFLRKYKFARTQLQAYKKTNPEHLETIRAFLKAGMPKKHAGLPRSLLVEIARDPKFIELQKKMNELEEDGSRLAQLTTKLSELDQQIAEEQKKFALEVKELEGPIKKTENPSKKEALLAEKKVREQKLQKTVLLRRIILEAKQGVANEVERFTTVWNSRKDNLKAQQNSTIQASFQNVEKDLTHWLDQSELLFYEIHNGAGEHLRYQMASTEEGKALGSKPGKYKKGDKEQQWAFDGEIWEDEVGHYRSSLKNVCPEDETQRVSEAGSSQSPTLAQSMDK